MRREIDPLRTCVEGSDKLLPEEWQALLTEEASSKHQRAADAEVKFYKPSRTVLFEKGHLRKDQPPLLGSSPISDQESNYSLDVQKTYDAGVAAGNGTEA